MLCGKGALACFMPKARLPQAKGWCDRCGGGDEPLSIHSRRVFRGGSRLVHDVFGTARGTVYTVKPDAHHRRPCLLSRNYLKTTRVLANVPSYDNPYFVEDSVRALAMSLKSYPRISWFRCGSENFESLHQHNAFAQIEMRT